MNLYTYTGKIAYPEGAPCLQDIAVALSRECRYAGNSVHWWCVALHSFVVADLLPDELKIHGLMHDAAECITGDVPKPCKLPEIEEMEDGIIRRIYFSLGLRWPTEEQQKLIHEADYNAACGEIHAGAGTLALREIYPDHPRSNDLVKFYRRFFPPMDCITADSKCVREFMWRYERYNYAVR